MQQPPTKVKESLQVKCVFSEQRSQLQMRHHQYTDLFEDIRSFSKHRAAIEKEYGQALQRLAALYQKRDWQRGYTDSLTPGNVFAVWRSVVDATAQAAASRQAAAEEYRRLTGQASTSLYNAKDVRAKPRLEQLQRVQGEVVDALYEVHTLKKSYHQLSHIANVAREKATDAQTRSRKKEHGVFHFKTGQHKMTTKVNTRLKDCEDRLTEARNEYLLGLAAVNVHYQNYYRSDLPHIVEQMDRDVYDDLRSHFMLICETEIDSCLSSHKQYSVIWDSVGKVTREKNIQQFLQESVAFSQTTGFPFQPAPHDKVSSLQELCASAAEGCLAKESKTWASKAAKDYKIITHGERVLRMLESRLKLLSGETALSVEQKIAEVENSVRKAKLSRLRAEARLALLTESVPGTEQWRHDAMNQAEEELERERRLSEHRRSTEDFSEEEFDLTDFDDHDDESIDIFAGPVSEACVYPAVILCYQASESDEPSIIGKEDGDMQDWQNVCISCGRAGCVPECFVQSHTEDPVQLDSSFSSTLSSGNKDNAGSGGELIGVARALFSYQAQSAKELSFQKGALITLLRCHQGEVDDGFWEGELNGQIGLFPSLVVELIDFEDEEEKQEPLDTSSLSPISSPKAKPLTLNCTSSTTPFSSLTDKQDLPQIVANITTGTEVGIQTCTDVPRSQLRPCRPPPPPPTLRPSPQH